MTVPRRFRNWILLWTPIVWLVLELVMYPKNVPVSKGAAAVLKGFFSASIAAYPAWMRARGGGYHGGPGASAWCATARPWS